MTVACIFYYHHYLTDYYPHTTHTPDTTGHSQESINAKHVRDDQLYNEAIQNVGQSYGTVYMGSPPQSLLPLSGPQGGAHSSTINSSQTIPPHIPGDIYFAYLIFLVFYFILYCRCRYFFLHAFFPYFFYFFYFFILFQVSIVSCCRYNC
jgi:hypothetical protein